jgi:hypothetical protein
MTDTHLASEVSPEEYAATLAEAAELALADYHAHLDQLAEIAYEDRFSEGYEPDFFEDGPRAYAH